MTKRFLNCCNASRLLIFSKLLAQQMASQWLSWGGLQVLHHSVWTAVTSRCGCRWWVVENKISTGIGIRWIQVLFHLSARHRALLYPQKTLQLHLYDHFYFIFISSQLLFPCYSQDSSPGAVTLRSCSGRPWGIVLVAAVMGDRSAQQGWSWALWQRNAWLQGCNTAVRTDKIKRPWFSDGHCFK